MSVSTLCIPRINSNFTRKHIEAMFRHLEWGTLHEVFMYKKCEYTCVIIKLGWSNSPRGKHFKSLIENDCINVVYEFDIYKIVKRQQKKKA